MSISSAPPGATAATTTISTKLVIGAVAALAVGIGAAAGGFLLANRNAVVGAGASYVPASAPFYAELRLNASPTQDAALREMLGHFPPIEGIDLNQPLYPQLGERIDEMLAGEETELSWAEDVVTWFDGRLGIAVLDIPTEAMTGELPGDSAAVPSMVVLLGVTDRGAAEAAIDRALSEAAEPMTVTEQDHGGVTIHVAGDEGAYALTDDQLLIAPTAEDIGTALDAHDGGGSALAEADEISRLTDALPDDWLAFGIYDFTDLMAVALDEAAAESTAMADAFRGLLESQPLRGAIALTASGDRVSVEVASDPPTGSFAVENADRSLADEVPADVVYYSEGGNLGASLAAVIGPIKEAAAATPGGEEQVGTIEAALGADLEDLVSWIGDGALAIGFDGAEAYGGMVLVPTDRDAADRRLSQLASFASLAALDPSTGVAVEESEVESVTVTTIRWSDPSAMPDPMLPVPETVAIQYALTDDRAIIGVGESFVERILTLDGADALTSVDRFSSSLDALGGSSNTAVAWLDLTGVREAIETAVGSEIEMFAGDYESKVKPWLVPLDRFVSVTRLEDDVLVQRTALLVD